MFYLKVIQADNGGNGHERQNDGSDGEDIVAVFQNAIFYQYKLQILPSLFSVPR